jgi:hypothetical protein
MNAKIREVEPGQKRQKVMNKLQSTVITVVYIVDVKSALNEEHICNIESKR